MPFSSLNRPVAAIARQLRGAVVACFGSDDDARTAYLSQAQDLVDLECRMREWDEQLLTRRQWPPMW